MKYEARNVKTSTTSWYNDTKLNYWCRGNNTHYTETHTLGLGRYRPNSLIPVAWVRVEPVLPMFTFYLENNLLF